MQVLECSYKDIHGKVSVGNIRLPNVRKNERNKYVDLIINFQNEKIIIELNRNFNGNYTRNLIYAFNVISNNYNIGDTNIIIIKKVTRVILVNLNWFKNKNDLCKEIINVPYPSNRIDGHILKIININLDCYQDICYNDIENIDKLGKLLSIRDKRELDLLIKENKLLKIYRNKLLDLLSDESYKEKLMNDNIERNLEIQDQYFTGLDDGFAKARKEMVINMFNNGVSIDVISKSSNLSVKVVKEIIDNKENKE